MSQGKEQTVLGESALSRYSDLSLKAYSQSVSHVPAPANNGSADAEGVEIPAPEPSGNKNLLGGLFRPPYQLVKNRYW